MSNVIVKTSRLSKSYGGIKALDNIDMTIKKGQIYGLIGLNGAGKTTLIRAIAGLVEGNSGNIELFGESNNSKIEVNRKRMGCLIETPGVYSYRTVYENLCLQRIQKGIPGEECIQKILKTMKLTDVKNKKVKELSVGTKQILGIAMALIGDPEFLILDEPINGLDPIKIIEIRELLKKLNEERGITILMSSHILGELYQLANCYGIIHNGKLIEEITAKELKDKCKKFIYIKVDDGAKASVILNKELLTENFVVLPNNTIKLYDYIEESGRVAAVLVKSGIVVEQIMPTGDDLEGYFSKVIGGTSNG